MIHWKAYLIIGAVLFLAWLIRDRLFVAWCALTMPRHLFVKMAKDAYEDSKKSV